MRKIILMFVALVMSVSPAFAKDKETAYERIMRTGVIRCGFAVWKPTLMKDPNTGDFSGVYYDYMEAMGKRLGFEIEWAYELSLATYLEDMNAGKFDVECSGGWPNARRGKVAEYTTPLYYTPVYLYAKEGDDRFDNNYESINNSEIRFATMPGELSEDYRDEFFPKSQNISISPSSMLSELLIQLTSGKADVGFYDGMSAREFMRQRPGEIKRIAGPPVKVIPNTLSVAKGEFKLVSMLDQATLELMFDGVIDRIMKKHGLDDEVALKPVRPYQLPE